MIEKPEGFNYQGTSISEPPTLWGRFGEAWRVRMPPLGSRERLDHDASVGTFLVRAPDAHPLWDHYAISVVHLRPIAGVKPAHITMPGATHEFMIMSLSPQDPLPASLDAGPGWQLHWLTPIDVIEQFTAANDAVANEILELAVRAIIDGRISPDQDWRSAWRETIAATARHFAHGTHNLERH